MNFIAWDCAISLFPKATFVDKLSFTCHADAVHEYTTVAQNWKPKYRQCGYEVLGSADWSPEVAELEVPRGLRQVGDRHCWRIPFDTTGNMLIYILRILQVSNRVFCSRPAVRRSHPNTHIDRASLRCHSFLLRVCVGRGVLQDMRRFHV